MSYTKHYLLKEVKVCQNCFGEGIKTIGDEQFTCSLCEGEGMVTVEKDIKVTVTPKKRSYVKH